MRILNISLGLLFCMSATAQDIKHTLDSVQLCVVYMHKIMTSDIMGNNVVDSTMSVLEVGNLVTKYGDLSDCEILEVKKLSLPFAQDDPRAGENLTIYQNYPKKGTLTVREGLLPKFYLYEEEQALQWNLLQETDKVLSYSCQCANVTYAGRNWRVSYTEDIPMPYGPWKLSGLPGLILKAESADGVHCYEPYAILSVKPVALTYYALEKDMKTKRNAFVSNRNRLKLDERWAKNPFYYLTLEEKKKRIIYVMTPGNKYGLTPRTEINGIVFPFIFPLNCELNRFQPLELK